MPLKTIWDLPALIPGEETRGFEFKSPPSPAAPLRSARCPGPWNPGPARRGPADPITCSVRPAERRGRGNGGGSRAGSRGGQVLWPHPRTSTGCKCPGSRREGQAGSLHPCGCRRNQAPPKLLNVSFIKAFRGLFFGVCLQTHKDRAAVWGSFLMEKGLGDPRHKRNPGSAFNGQDSMRGTLCAAGGGEGPPGAA